MRPAEWCWRRNTERSLKRCHRLMARSSSAFGRTRGTQAQLSRTASPKEEMTCPLRPKAPVGLTGAVSGASGVNKPSAAKRPILPQGFLEADHYIFRIQTGFLRQAAEDVCQDLLLHFHTAADREKDFNQDEIVGPVRGEIRVFRIKAEVVSAKVQDPLTPILFRHAGSNQRAMHGFEHRGLEFPGLAFAYGKCN